MQFNIRVTRTEESTADFVIEAETLDEAKNKALNEAGDHYFERGDPISIEAGEV